MEIVIGERLQVRHSLRVVNKFHVISRMNFVVDVGLDASTKIKDMGANYVIVWIIGECNWVCD